MCIGAVGFKALSDSTPTSLNSTQSSPFTKTPKMASLCRSALMSSSRSISSRSRTLTQSCLNALNPKPMSSPFASSTKAMSSATRFVSVLGSLESMMPLHSAIASARLKSNIAFDSTCWSCLSQGLASPL